MTSVNQTIKDINQSSVAQELNISQQAVSQWVKAGRVPAGRVLDVEKITGISRHVLNPVIYPEIENSRIAHGSGCHV
tara:strand:- start:2099 stop:2329 length:231 start_codon:yes stop_codon:yes gene_type:complete